jgi:hypothetical protein
MENSLTHGADENWYLVLRVHVHGKIGGPWESFERQRIIFGSIKGGHKFYRFCIKRNGR